MGIIYCKGEIFMKKKFLVGALCCLATAGLASCGETDTVKVGVIANISTAAQFYGEEVVNGVKLAANEINSAGGITIGDEQKKVELIIKDDTADATMAVTQYNSMADDVDVVIGAVLTSTSVAVANAASADGIPCITPSGTGDDITYSNNKLNESVFRTCFIDSYQGTILAKLAKDKGYKKVVVLQNEGDAYSQGICQSFSSGASEYGYEVVQTLNYSSSSLNTSMASFVTTIKNSDCDAIVMPDYTDQIRTAVSSCREAGITLPFLGGDGWDGALTDYAHPEYFDNCFYVTGIYAGDTSTEVVDFYSSYKSAFKDPTTGFYTSGHSEVPSMFAALAYDAMNLAASAITKAGTLEHSKVVSAIKGITFTGATGTLTFDAKNNPQKSAPVIEFKDGGLSFYKAL